MYLITLYNVLETMGINTTTNEAANFEKHKMFVTANTAVLSLKHFVVCANIGG